MKKLIYFLSIFISIVAASAQPNKIHYQGILRAANGNPLQNNALRLRLSVLDSITTGSVLYVETQSTTTNAGGQFTVYLGGGTALGNPFASIAWENGNNKYLKIEIDPNGGSNFQHFGTSLLVSVPYVLHAKSASEIKEGAIIRGNNGETYQISIGSNGPIWNCNPPVPQASSGTDQWNLPGIVFNLSGNTPGSGNSGSWSKISGSGGLIEVNTSPNSVFVRGTDSIYSLEWKIQGGCGSTKDTTFLRFAPLIENQSCFGETNINYLGKNYPIVRIGNSCWMAQNLDVGSRINGSIGQSNNGVIEKFCYNDLASNCTIFGGMYQWAEAVQYQNGASNSVSPSPSFSSKLQGICPTGWHLPTRQEWCSLINFYDGTKTCQNSGESFPYVGGALKSLSYWNTPNGGATNRSGFSALSNGYFYLGNYSGLGNDAGFWSTQDQGNQATYFWLDYQLSNIGIDQGNKAVANAVRCVKDTLCAPTSSFAGPDQLNLSGTTATLAANAPAAGETGAWSIVTGNGGSLSSASSRTATFTKGTDSAYTLVWTISGLCGTTRDTMNISFTRAIMNVSCPGVSSVAYVGENYPTVLIGNQCWLAKNLNVGTMIQGTFGSANQSNNGIVEKFCYNDNLSNCGIYGGLYQWAEAVQYQSGASNTASLTIPFSGNVKGICPAGWHLPSSIELGTLVNNVGGASTAGSALKSTSSLWLSYPLNSNISGFSALPAGNYNYNGFFFGLGDETSFLSSSEQPSFDAFLLSLSNNNSSVSISNDKSNGYSVRCVKDTLCAPTSSSAGPDQLNLSGTTASLAANAPAAGETGAWSIISGNGGNFSSTSSRTATFTKGNDSAYTLVWTISGPCGSSQDSVNLRFLAPVGTTCGQTVTYAGESYPTVKIGTQCWLAKNLNVGTMVNSAGDQTNNSTMEKYCYNNDPANCATYGGLYQWAEAVQYQNGASNTSSPNPAFSGNVMGVCPNGWHLPTDAEYCTLTTFLDVTANCSIFSTISLTVGGMLKSTSGLWSSPNTGATNSSGFSAQSGGYRHPNGTFINIGTNTYFLSSSESSVINSIYHYLSNNNSFIIRNQGVKDLGASIRCIKD